MICIMLACLAFISPTNAFLEEHPMDEIKYHLRLDHVTLVYKELFDKAILQEREGLLGYHGDSLEYRIFQDVIRMVVEEVNGISIRESFHFLDIPHFRQQEVDIAHYFLPDENRGYQIERQLFPVNRALYENYNRIGFCSVVHFTKNSSPIRSKKYVEDLKVYFEQLGMEPELVDEAFAIGKKHLKEDRGILLQIFDVDEEHYYIANPNGYPYESGNEVKLILTDAVLNPHSSIVIKRYDKMQSATIKKYEAELRQCIKKGVTS